MYKKVVNKKTFFDAWYGLSTPLQRQLIEEWLMEEKHAELYYQWLDEWEHENLQTSKNVNKSYDNFLISRSAVEDRSHQKKSIFHFPNNFFFKLVAATIIVAILSTSLYLSRNFIQYETYTTAYGEVKKIVLPDNSEVYLNANTSLKIPRFGFMQGTRSVYLQGEAEFLVVHTAAHTPFIVHGNNNLKVKVLGTKFLLYTRGDNSKVVLNEGSIELSITDNNRESKTMLKPGEVLIANSNKIVERVKVDNTEKMSSWKNNEFDFDNTSLKKIGVMVQEHFGYEVSFETDDLAQKTISGSFTAESAIELLDAIAQLLDMNYKCVDNKVYFSE